MPEDSFAMLCDSCAQCVEVCPKTGILMDQDGLPVATVAIDTCGRCYLCADVCTRGALEAPRNGCAPTNGKADPRHVSQLIEAAMPAIVARFGARR